MQYKVIEAVDYLDSNPTESIFSTRWEADEYVSERINLRVTVFLADADLSLYQITEKEHDALMEYESSFFRVEAIY